MTNNEKTYYYKFIKPKLKALLAFSGTSDVIINGGEFILPERINSARDIIRHLQQKYRRAKIILSGSYLFKKEFKDIDVFIFRKYVKEDYRRKNIHLTFLPEQALNSLMVYSISKISISNVNIALSTISVSLNDILKDYELLINEILNDENPQKKLRDFILQTEYFVSGVILNPIQLQTLVEKFKKNTLLLLRKYIVERLILSCSKKDLLNLSMYITDYQKLQQEYKASNLQHYINTYQEVIDIVSL